MKREIILREYNDQWVEWFEQIQQFLMNHLSKNIISIEHVGSTSVPGLLSKPIIDIDIVIEKENFIST